MGRPPRDRVPSTTTSLRLSPDDQLILAELGQRWNLPGQSDVIRQAIRKAWAVPQAADIAERIVRLTAQVEQVGLRLDDAQPIVTKAEMHAVLQESGLDEAVQLLSGPVLGLLQAHIARWGWFYPPRTTTAQQAILDLREGRSREPASFLRSAFPSFWCAGEGPPTWARSDPRWLRAIKNRLGLNPRGELYDFSLRSLRAELRIQRHVVSFFQPEDAYRLYRKWLGSTSRPVVWDPSCGFGARLLGFAAAYPEGTYFGTEPAAQTFGDLERLAAEMPCSVKLFCLGSEVFVPEPESLDLVLTSPPYFNTERYFLEPSQSWLAYPTLDRWEEGFVRPTLGAAYRGLKPNGKCVLNISRELEPLFLRQATDTGFTLVSREKLVLSAHPFNAGSEPNYEPILVFQKGADT